MIFLETGTNQMCFKDNDSYFREEETSQNYFISESPVMKLIYKKIQKLALSSYPVLILGASGAGRTKVAYEIFLQNKKNYLKEFLKFDCYGLNQDIIEKNLFGDEDTRKGLLNNGSKNTLFIKNIDSLDSSLQKKLLFFILDYKQKQNCPRLICSSSEDLSKQVKEGCFSDQLFRVLNHDLLIVPSLRERVEDIPFLISYFNNQNNFKGMISKDAMDLLKSHSWNGGITELENICLQYSIIHRDKKIITVKDIPLETPENLFLQSNIKYDPNVSLEEILNRYIELSVDHFSSKQESAKALGISVKTIYNKIKTGSINIKV